MPEAIEWRSARLRVARPFARHSPIRDRARRRLSRRHPAAIIMSECRLTGGPMFVTIRPSCSARTGSTEWPVKRLPDSRGGSAYMWSLLPGGKLLISTPGNHFELRRGRPECLRLPGDRHHPDLHDGFGFGRSWSKLSAALRCPSPRRPGIRRRLAAEDRQALEVFQLEGGGSISRGDCSAGSRRRALCLWSDRHAGGREATYGREAAVRLISCASKRSAAAAASPPSSSRSDPAARPRD